MKVHLIQPGPVVAIAVCNIGNAIPFGLASGPTSNHVNLVEWILSVLYMIAALGHFSRILGWTAHLSTYGWLYTSALWAASASYAGWLPHATTRERIAFAMIFGGIAFVSLFAYAQEKHARSNPS